MPAPRAVDMSKVNNNNTQQYLAGRCLPAFAIPKVTEILSDESSTDDEIESPLLVLMPKRQRQTGSKGAWKDDDDDDDVDDDLEGGTISEDDLIMDKYLTVPQRPSREPHMKERSRHQTFGSYRDAVWEEEDQVEEGHSRTWAAHRVSRFLKVCEEIGRVELEVAPHLDHQLLMMAFVYFMRINPTTLDWTVPNFYLLLYLAVEVEEEGICELLDYIEERFWDHQKRALPVRRHFQRRKNHLWRRMSFRAWVRVEEVLQAMQLFHEHWIFRLNRSIVTSSTRPAHKTVHPIKPVLKQARPIRIESHRPLKK
ncbi:MAG: hypothetical protein Q8P67_00300 [archaeon]|nr:hypothetical protein [archaeon]